MFPLVAPTGTQVEVIWKARRDTLISRGYVDEPPPPKPEVKNQPGIISADVVHAPWDELRAENIQHYDIPGLNVVPDTERQGCWPTVRRAWENASGTHHLVLTDDLTLPKGFWAALNQAVTLFPDNPISLFTIKKGASFALSQGCHWCISWGCTGAANVLPTKLIESFLEWNDKHVKEGCPYDDGRLTAWATHTGIGILSPVPCLVEHGMFPSVIEDSPLYGVPHSTAIEFQDDVTNIDWTQGASNPYFIGLSVKRPDSWLKGI